MSSIYSFLAGKMNAIILICGVILIVLLVGNYISILGHYNQIKSIMNWKNTKSMLNKKTHEVEDQADSEKVTPDSIRELETAFNKTCSWHEAFSQLIPLFPLFGILGTVAGLIMQLNTEDLSTLFSSLHLALGSTFYGLIFAIILKFLDAIGPARTINETEIILEDYDKKVNNAVMLGNISE